MLLGYFGPETTLPLASAVMTVVGGVLMVLRMTASHLRIPSLLRKLRSRQ